MQLTKLQEEAVAVWRAGSNVRVVAVPGAGKSAVLIEACAEADGLCLILAYNHELCQDTKYRIVQMGLQERVACMTFHGLATYCVAPTPDDVALQDVLELLQTTPPKRRLVHVKHVLIDEAQDLRGSFMQLVPLLVSLCEDTQYMLVGDPRQLLYDYHEDDPASLEYLADPATYFRSRRPWRSMVLDETHRMSPEMARFVSTAFDVDIKSARPETPVPAPVEVYTINLWEAGGLLRRLLHSEARHECTVLVPYKKNNKPLEKTINTLSHAGYRMFVHGIDGQDPRVRRRKLTISTWHAAKGTQQRVCVVLGMEDRTVANPAYVALTRGVQRLIVVMDKQSPSKRVLEAVQRLNPRDVKLDASTRALACSDAAAEDRTQVPAARQVLSLDDWRPSGSGRWLTKLFSVDGLDEEEDMDGETMEASLDEEDEIVAGLVGEHEDVADVYRLACVMAAEHEANGRVRRWAEIKRPMRIKRDDHKSAISQGSHARFVPPNVPENALLDADTRCSFFLATAKETLQCNDWCFLACVCRAWNSYHHTLRQMQPFDWMNEQKFEQGLETIREALRDDTDVVFDGRLHRTTEDGEKTLHVRVDAMSAQRALMFVWSASLTRSHQIEAALKATLHTSGECRLVNLRTGKMVRVLVEDSKKVIAELIKPSVPRCSTDFDMQRFGAS